jgi:2-C-methyl-D-erythritol 4-phosphate cytidylyltransferase
MLLLAAGRGVRFGGLVPKAFLPLLGKPLLLHAAERLTAACARNDRVALVVVVHPADRARLDPWMPSLAHLGDVRFADGGASRQESMQRGLAAAPADADLVLVHDAARPLVPVDAVRECLAAAARTGAALLAIPAPDTLKRVRDDRVEATLDRDGIWLAQTPQVLRRELLERALAAAAASGFTGTDDVSLAERIGAPIEVVRGSPTNLKITRSDDLPLAEAILAAALA